MQTNVVERRQTSWAGDELVQMLNTFDTHDKVNCPECNSAVIVYDKTFAVHFWCTGCMRMGGALMRWR